MPMHHTNRFGSNAGIAIGPILFVIALLGILAAVLSAGSGSYTGAAVADRVTSDIVNQANLIRGKINDCNLRCTNARALDVSGGLPCPNDSWPDKYTSQQVSVPVVSAEVLAVTSLRCPATLDSGSYANIWLLPEPTQLPPMTKGFESNPWKYVNAGDSGGRCIWTKPDNGNSSTSIVEALKRAKGRFTVYDDTSKQGEVNYNPADTDQKFVLIITPPTGTLDTNCAVP